MTVRSSVHITVYLPSLCPRSLSHIPSYPRPDLPPRSRHPRQHEEHRTRRSPQPRPNLCTPILITHATHDRTTDGTPRQRRDTHTRERHAEPRADHFHILGHARHSLWHERLECGAGEAVDSSEDVDASCGLDCEPAPGDDADAEAEGGGDVQGAKFHDLWEKSCQRVTSELLP